MGGFATSVFNLLLGWIRSFVTGFWDLVNSQQARDGLNWLADHWLLLVGVIALAGIVVDYLVWFIRWRPYYVWRSWLRRLTHRGEQARYPETSVLRSSQEMEKTAVYTRPWDYPTPQAPREETAPLPYAEPENDRIAYAYAQTGEQAHHAPRASYQPGEGYTTVYSQDDGLGYDPGYAVQPPYGERWEARYPQPSEADGANAWEQHDAGNFPDAPETEDYGAALPEHPGLSETGLQESLGWASQPEASQPPRREGRALRSQRAIGPLKRVRSGISQVAHHMAFLGRDEDEEQEITYTPPPPAVDKRRAFHAPVYPSRWKHEEDEEEEQP